MKLLPQFILTPVTLSYALWVYLYDILFQLEGCGFCERNVWNRLLL